MSIGSAPLDESEAIVSTEIEQIVRDRRRITELESCLASALDRIEALEARLEIVEASSTTKEGKVRKLVEKAENLREGNQRGVTLTVRDIVGATGVSRRYAYDLIDGDNNLPSEYHWILTREEAARKQYGNLEIDRKGQSAALVIDFERLHSDRSAVNKFTTRSTEEGC